MITSWMKADTGRFMFCPCDNVMTLIVEQSGQNAGAFDFERTCRQSQSFDSSLVYIVHAHDQSRQYIYFCTYHVNAL